MKKSKKFWYVWMNEVSNVNNVQKSLEHIMVKHNFTPCKQMESEVKRWLKKYVDTNTDWGAPGTSDKFLGVVDGDGYPALKFSDEASAYHTAEVMCSCRNREDGYAGDFYGDWC